MCRDYGDENMVKNLGGKKWMPRIIEYERS